MNTVLLFSREIVEARASLMDDRGCGVQDLCNKIVDSMYEK